MATIKQKARNQRVIERLETQLKSGVKNRVNRDEKGKRVSMSVGVDLEVKDIDRINKEISILKTRI